GVAWGALGHATACYEAALEHATTRIQFGRPLAKAQHVQVRLSNMLQTLTSMQLYCVRLAELEAAGAIRPEQASLAKVHNTRAAREIAADARDLLGGNLAGGPGVVDLGRPRDRRRRPRPAGRLRHPAGEPGGAPQGRHRGPAHL